MKSYKILLKLQLKDMIRRRSKKQFATLAVLGTLYAVMVIIAIIGIVLSAPMIRETNSAVSVLSGILFFDFTITIITGTASAISFLFLSKDNEFFASLPVKSSTVFFAKFTTLIITELVISLIIILPTFLTLGITVGLPPLFFFMIPVAIIAVPIFATVIIVILSMPIVFLATKFKNRGLLKTIIAVTVFAVFFALYFLFVNAITQGVGNIDFSGLATTSYIIYPLYMLMNFATHSPVFSLSLAQSMLVSFAIFFVPILVFLFISYALSLLAYQKIIRNSLESRGNLSSKSGQFSTSSIKNAIVKKEWRLIIRDTSVTLNTIMTIILAPILIVFLVLSGAGIGQMGLPTQSMALIEWVLGVAVLMTLIIGSNGSSSCISREGALVFYMKMLPVSYKDQLRAKQRFYNIISAVAISISVLTLSVLTAFRGNFVWWMPLVVAIVAFSWSIAVTNLAIYFDLRSPKLDWRNVREVVKSIKNQAVYLLWMLFSTIVFAALVLVVILSGMANRNISLFIGIYLGMFGLIGAAAAVLFDLLLHKNANKFFKNL